MAYYSAATQRLLVPNPPILHCKTTRHTQCTTINHRHSSSPSSSSSSSVYLQFTHQIILTRKTLHCSRLHSVFHPTSSPHNNPIKHHLILETFVLLALSLVLLCLRLFSSVLLPNFPHRWNQLVAFSEEAEARTSGYPSYLWQAIVAYEDRRFFQHCGIDPVGIARAVLSFSARGGGSTITQQLVKNTFLKNERTFSRKIVEMVLALALERTVPKWRILSCYVSKIYWGHGIYGIESASVFYFGKDPSLLSLGESAMLAGIIPAPELRSPLRDPSRAKTFQARVLKRLVEVGFLDIEAALVVVKQSLSLHVDGPESAATLLYPPSLSDKLFGRPRKLKEKNGHLVIKKLWDWEKESKIWEAREEMERWAIRIRTRASATISL